MLAMDRNGETITHMTYDEWGRPLEEPRLDHNFAGIKNLNNYTGYTYNYILDLYFAQNRFYNPNTRQFITQDPIKDGMNWYVYCEANPLTRVDWLGLKPVSIRSYVESRGGEVSRLYYDDFFNAVSVTFILNNRAISVTMSGENSHELTVKNVGDSLFAHDYALQNFFYHGNTGTNTATVNNKPTTGGANPPVNGAIGSMSMSTRGFNLLKYHETSLGTLKGWGLGAFEGDELVGIYPHYVFRISKNTGEWESDGGMTFGFGHFVSPLECDIDKDEKALVDTYARGLPIIPGYIPSNGVSYAVPGSKYMSMESVSALLWQDIKTHEEQFNKLLLEHGVVLNQAQFDALLNLRYHKYRLGKDIDDLLRDRDLDKVKWEQAIKGLIGSGGDLNRASDLVDLFNNGKYPSSV